MKIRGRKPLFEVAELSPDTLSPDCEESGRFEGSRSLLGPRSKQSSRPEAPGSCFQETFHCRFLSQSQPKGRPV